MNKKRSAGPVTFSSCLLCSSLLDSSSHFKLKGTVTVNTNNYLIQVLENVVGNIESVKKYVNENICASCFDLLNAFDDLTYKLIKIRNQLKSMFYKRDMQSTYQQNDACQDIFGFNYNDPNQYSTKNENMNDTYGMENNSHENFVIDNTKDTLDLLEKVQHSIDCPDEVNDLANDYMDTDMFNDSDVESETKVETPDTPLICETCNEIFPSEEDLKKHLPVHKKKKKFVCEICGQSYSHASALNTHIGMHNGINPFTCSHCGKTFTQKGGLIKHMRIHTGDKPYQCHLCGRQFTHYTSFHVHNLSHSGEKSFICNICGLALISSSHLKRHMRIHTGEKKYSCDICGRKFAENYNLSKHKKMHLQKVGL